MVLASGYHPGHSVPGIIWTAATAAVMFALAAGKPAPALRWVIPCCRPRAGLPWWTGILATAVMAGLVLNAALGWWWADPGAGYVLVFYAAREAREVFFV